MSNNLHLTGNEADIKSIAGVLQCYGAANLMWAPFAAFFSLRMLHFSMQHFNDVSTCFCT